MRHGESLGNVDPAPPITPSLCPREPLSARIEQARDAGVGNGHLFEGAAPR